MIQEEGVATLWNGTVASLVLVCNPAIQFTVYELLKRRADKANVSKKPKYRLFIN